MSKEYKYGFRAKPGRDDVIIKWLNGIQASDKSYYIREALRDYLNRKIPQDSSPSSNTIGEANNKVFTNKLEEDDAEVSSSTLEDNLNSWID